MPATLNLLPTAQPLNSLPTYPPFTSLLQRTRRSSSADGNRASPAATQTAAGAGGSAAAGKKGRGGGSKKVGDAAKAAAGKAAGGAGKKQQSKAAGGAGKKRQGKAAAAPVAQEVRPWLQWEVLRGVWGVLHGCAARLAVEMRVVLHCPPGTARHCAIWRRGAHPGGTCCALGCTTSLQALTCIPHLCAACRRSRLMWSGSWRCGRRLPAAARST